jgi:MoaA/NifB/PqqE/SkfB family radical SAM enzyme
MSKFSIGVSDHVILRAESGYGSRIAFDTKRLTTTFLTTEEFVLLDALRQCGGLDEGTLHEILVAMEGSDSQSMNLSDFLDHEILSRNEAPATGEAAVEFGSGGTPDAGLFYLSRPTAIELCITRRCNLRCVHCNVSATSERPPEKLDISFWEDILEQCVEAQVLVATVTGGEPFLRHGWTRLLRKLATSRLGVVILTNGTQLSDDELETVANHGIRLAISLDGTTADEHDTFRRAPGSFDATVRNCRRLRERGVPYNLTMTLYEGNVQRAEDMLVLGEELGAAKLIFSPMYSVGRAATPLGHKYFAQRDLLKATMDRLLRLSQEGAGPDVILGDPTEKDQWGTTNRHSGPTPMSRRHPGLCKAGTYGLAVDEDGLAYSCLRGLQTRIFPIGDLREQTLLEVWESDRWRAWRDPSLPRVPCRVEEIERTIPAEARGLPVGVPRPHRELLRLTVSQSQARGAR